MPVIEGLSTSGIRAHLWWEGFPEPTLRIYSRSEWEREEWKAKHVGSILTVELMNEFEGICQEIGYDQGRESAEEKMSWAN